MKLSFKTYMCPVCCTQSTHHTNHSGDIFERCKCGSLVLHCMEPNAVEKRLQMPYEEVKLIFYRFNIEYCRDMENYFQLLMKLKNHYSCFEYAKTIYAYMHTPTEALYDHFSSNETTIAKVTKVIDKQLCSDIGRLYLWSETKFPNKNFIEGYYAVNAKNGNFISLTKFKKQINSI